jgi:hypothetical protein
LAALPRRLTSPKPAEKSVCPRKKWFRSPHLKPPP